MSHSLGSAAFVLDGALLAFSFAFLLALVRLWRGPSLPDRVVALDLMTVIVVCFVGTYAIVTDEPAFLDAGIVLALITFLATIAFARYVEKRVEPDRRRSP